MLDIIISENPKLLLEKLKTTAATQQRKGGGMCHK
jgi:hypothetical protein